MTLYDAIDLLNIMDDTGTISYGLALFYSTTYSLGDKFVSEYGLPGEWECPETGKPIGVDLGEYLMWVYNNR
jgi:hypothetical protein